MRGGVGSCGRSVCMIRKAGIGDLPRTADPPIVMDPLPTQVAHYVGNADEFPVLRSGDFFNHAGVSPLPRRAGDALRAFADQYERRAYLDSGFYRQVEELRESAAAMIAASPEEIAFVKNTSEGIATVAAGIDWNRGDRIVTTAVEYPANMYPWMDVARRFNA